MTLLEKWASVPSSKDYEVSTLGRVRRLGRILKQRPSVRGYPTLHVSYEDGTKKNRVVHALVMQAFVGPRPEGAQIAHSDGDRTNNCLENLRYCSPAENRADDIANGTRPQGESHGAAKLTDREVLSIRARHNEGRRVLASDYGVTTRTIYRVLAKRNWAHV